jgi:hypothetical protein
MIHRVFENSRIHKKLIGLKSNPSDTSFWCGYVIDFNDEYVILQSISKYFYDDGVVIEKTENISHIETSGDYFDAYEAIIKKKNTQFKSFEIADINTPDFFTAVLNNPIFKHQFLSIEIAGDNGTIGYIKEIEDGYVEMVGISNIGRLEEAVLYKIEDIQSIHINCTECRRRQEFFEMYQSK